MGVAKVTALWKSWSILATILAWLHCAHTQMHSTCVHALRERSKRRLRIAIWPAWRKHWVAGFEQVLLLLLMLMMMLVIVSLCRRAKRLRKILRQLESPAARGPLMRFWRGTWGVALVLLVSHIVCYAVLANILAVRHT
jgi:hypothetical protein